ncbi:MAG: sortase [Patescibacteria group bacterium]
MYSRRIKSFIAKILIILGVALILAIPVKDRLKEEPKPVENVSDGQDFDHGPIQADPKLLEGKYQEILLPTQIIIPVAAIDIPVKAARVVKGKWEVFEDSAAFGLGSNEPGSAGNTVIFAHARRGLFLPLREVKLSDKVYVMTKDDWYSYQVNEIKEVLPNDISVIKPTEDETLTLYTCSGFADSKRLIVIAKRT